MSRSRQPAPADATATAQVEVVFQPDGARVRIPLGGTLLQAARAAGLALESVCGGEHTCGKCKVQVLSDGGPPTEAERELLTDKELADDVRLACCVVVTRPLTVRIPESSRLFEQKIAIEGVTRPVALHPAVRKRHLLLPEPSIASQAAHLERLQMALGEEIGEPVSLELLRELPSKIAHWHDGVAAVLWNRRLIELEPADTSAQCYGIAFDLGTTTVVGYLTDLNTGQQIAVAAAMNPQVGHGDDVISRMQFASSRPDGTRILQHQIVGVINEIIGRACEQAGISSAHIYDLVAVGNTCMTHLFLGLDTRALAQSPYIPVMTGPQTVGASELGVQINPRGLVSTLPNIAGFVGADTTGVMLATAISDEERPTLAVDVGTNGEVVVAANGRLLACSTAAGPCFEGARIGQGMRASTGAIERVRIEDDVTVTTVNGGPPRGICGSGLIDAVAELVKVGIVTEAGRMQSSQDLPNLAPALRARLRTTPDGNEFLLATTNERTEIVITQQDVRQLQLAKGAICAGIKMLLLEAGCCLEEVEKLLLAGAFGNYIRKESAVAIGLLPALPLERIHSVGNAAGAGARLALLSVELRQQALELARRTEHMELSFRPEFYDHFAEGMALRPMA